ncbi:MAG: 3-oxoacyl-(acyl-carrier-protein) synthase [Bacteriovoracaceae bacterium]|nr:3-oxoacyl-(acyl-carrier-protein) synthase [Bacteriovoracaceae bacterium]
MATIRAKILGIEDYFPEKVVTNKDLEKIVDTNDEWIVSRTGIHERRRSEAHETPSFMGVEASKKLFKKLSIDPLSIDLVMVATITSDHIFPAAACLVQRDLGLKNAFGFDLGAACSGYLYGLETARAFIESGRAKNVLLIAAEKMSAILDFQDRTTCVLFGDGGSASLVTAGDERSYIIDSLLRTDGSGALCLYMPAGGSKSPPTHETIDRRDHYVKQDGKTVYKRAVTDMADICSEILAKNKLTGSDIALFVPHQANIRIIDAASERMGLPKEKVAINIDRFGNTTAATIPTALIDCERKGQVKRGDLVLLASFGAGFTWGATLLRY